MFIEGRCRGVKNVDNSKGAPTKQWAIKTRTLQQLILMKIGNHRLSLNNYF